MLAQLVVIRRCNLSCGYCFEYDDVSPPVATAMLLRRVDALADLGNVVLTLTGGEPLLHPDLDRIIAHSVGRGMVTTTISNGYALTRSWIERLNRSGLTAIQISVDNIEPNELSQKSWTKVKKSLELLKEHARFGVNVNAVLGAAPAAETRQVVAEARELGFYMTVGIMHDVAGQIHLGRVGGALPELYDELREGSRKSLFHFAGEGWETRMLREGVAPWRCRAGGRFLYVDEAGIVSYCSQRRGEPGIDIEAYTRADLRRENDTVKGCEDRCTQACVRRASAVDAWRPAGSRLMPPRAAADLVQVRRSAGG
jgi:MoaA/NifB/PqqE/SkfB family radical SAM enzyme